LLPEAIERYQLSTDEVKRKMQIGSKIFLTEEELAKQLCKSVAALRLWRREGRGPAWTRIGQTPVYDPADVEAWVESLKRDPRARAAA
jgi:hypothetical protein